MSKEPKRNVYVGHRYVPKIMGEWDKENDYEGLSIVTNEGNSYTSKKRVPIGIDIENTEYWVSTGNYNAQVEGYRQEVLNFKKDINNNINDLKNDFNDDLRTLEENLNVEVGNIKNNLNDISINIKSFGAIGDGITNDSNALQQALLSLKEGGTLTIPRGVYNVPGLYEIYSNTHIIIKEGAKLISNNDSLRFHFPSYEKGYNGGVKNVVFSGGGSIELDWGIPGKVTFGLHHSKNITFKNLTIKSKLRRGHIFDLCGCSYINFDNITFKCGRPDEDKGHTEIIQVDWSSEGALSIKNNDDLNSIDGLPSKNITVKNCLFKGINDEYSGSPFGAHSRPDKPFKNIYFINNEVHDVIENDYIHGDIHFWEAENVRLENNLFINKKSKTQHVFTMSKDMGKDFYFLNNTILNNRDNEESVLRIENCDGVFIEGNTCKPYIETNSVLPTEFSYIRNSNNIKLVNNYIRNHRSLVFTRKYEDMEIRGNQIYNCIHLNNTTDDIDYEGNDSYSGKNTIIIGNIVNNSHYFTVIQDVGNSIISNNVGTNIRSNFIKVYSVKGTLGIYQNSGEYIGEDIDSDFISFKHSYEEDLKGLSINNIYNYQSDSNTNNENFKIDGNINY